MGRAIGAYEILDELGRGGQGAVYRARHIPTGAVRALKILESGQGDEALERFRREAQALARAGGAAVPIHEVGGESGRLWYAMDLCSGGSLEGRLKERGALPWRDAAALVARLARALDRCHELGLVHRDLKPANILFDDQGEARIADWGLVRDLGRSRLTKTGVGLGTPSYMAPEQAEGKPVDRRADVFSLGAILHELVAGARPFGGSSWVEIQMNVLDGKRDSLIKQGVPLELDAIVVRALAADREARQPRASVLADELDAVLAGRSAGKLSRPSGAAWAVALVAVASVVAVVALRKSGEPSPAIPTPSRSGASPAPDDAVRVTRALEEGTGPVASSDAPWPVVRSDAALLDAAARRGVVYALDEMNRLPARAETRSTRILKALALVAKGIPRDRRVAREILPPDASARVQDVFVVLEETDALVSMFERIGPDFDPVADGSGLAEHVRELSRALPALLEEPNELVEPVLAPLAGAARRGAFARAVIHPLPDPTIEDKRRQRMFMELGSVAGALEKRFPEPEKAPLVVATLRASLEVVLSQEHPALVPEAAARHASEGDAIAGRDPILGAALLVQAARERAAGRDTSGAPIPREAEERETDRIRRLLARVGRADQAWAKLVGEALAEAAR